MNEQEQLGQQARAWMIRFDVTAPEWAAYRFRVSTDVMVRALEAYARWSEAVLARSDAEYKVLYKQLVDLAAEYRR